MMSDLTSAEVVHGIFNAQLEGDFETFIAFWHADCEYTFPGRNAVGKTYKGHAGMLEFWETLGGALPDLGFEIVQIFVDGNEAAAEWRDWGANENGDRFESWGVTRMSLENGKVKTARDMMDTQKMFEILGP